MEGYDPFQPRFARKLIRDTLDPILDHYFRPRLLGADRLAKAGPLILAPNHSGNAFPYDGIVLDVLLWRRDGQRAAAKFRSVFEKEMTLVWWLRLFGIDDFWRRGGGVDVTFDNFDRLLARGERVVYFPEGVPGIGKGFWRRYRLQPFHTSFITLAARHRAPVHPLYIINAEWVLPFSFTLPPLDRLMQRWFRVPFLPLPIAPLGIVFPWAWYIAMPARMTFVVGEPIDMAAKVAQAGVTDLQNPQRERLRAVAEEVRASMQSEMDRLVRRFGRRPYQWRSLRRALARAWRQGRLRHALPPGWPTTLIPYVRDAERPPARNRLHAMLRDWDISGFYIPFGWPLLSLTRALRRPPCGYRGLTREQRREREGRWVWHLAERPLPPRDPWPR